MNQLDILTTLIVLGFGFQFALMRMMWVSINNRFDKMDGRMDKTDEKITDIDRRLCRLEGAFSSKECCILNQKENKEAK